MHADAFLINVLQHTTKASFFMSSTKLIVTHHAPDIDAITSVWLLKRFDHQVYGDAHIAFTHAGTTVSSGQAAAMGVDPTQVVHVDTGLGEFDHHQAERASERVSAASLVFQYLKMKFPELAQDWALEQIVEYALIDDHFEEYFFPDAASPRQLFAFRGILNGLEYAGIHTDESQMSFGMKCLDGIYASLRLQKKATDEIQEKGIVFNTVWGKSLAIETSNQSVLRYAQLQKYVLVIQRDPKQGNVRIKLAPEKGISLRELYKKIQSVDHVGSWFFHQGQHMLLNGSRKAEHIPTSLSLKQVMDLASSCQSISGEPIE